MRQILTLGVICFMLLFSVTSIYPVIKHFVIDRFGATLTQAGIFVSVNLIAYAIFSLIWGVVSDITGKRKVFISTGLLGNSVMLILQARAPDLYWLIFFRFVEGIFTVMVYSIAMTVVLDMEKRERYGRGMGLVGMGIAAGMAFGTSFGGVMGSIDPVLPFYTSSTIIFIAFLLSVVFLNDAAVSRVSSVLEGLKILAQRKELAVPYIFSFVDRFTAGFFVSVFPIMLGLTYLMEPMSIGLYISAFMIPFALLQYPGGLVIDMHGRIRPLIYGSLIYGAAISAVGFIEPPYLVVSLVIAGIVAAVMLPASSALSGDLAPEKLRGAVIGGFNLSGSFGFALGPVTATVIAERYGFSGSFIFAGVSVFATTALAVILIRMMKERFYGSGKHF